MADQSASAKGAAREVLGRLPDSASWEDIMYELYVRESMEAGLADLAAGRTIAHEDIRAEILKRVRGAP